ncbi:MAG: PD40 domain-containing protein, partial [Acidobacteria bacterium]|nr:PD40 domain-containing protein [Acidobacteriota bacterium]
VRTDGTGLRQLTDDIHRDRQPRWSPDRKRIAFHSNRSGKFEIWAMNADGSGLEQLTNDRRGIVIVPVWSPDGARLAYTIQGRNPSIVQVGKPWNEQTVRSLPPSSEPNVWFWLQDWSPDGKKLAGHWQRPDGSSAGIAVYSFDSQKFERVTDFGKYPRWLSDSRRLLFHDQGKLHLLDSRSGKVHEVLAVTPHEISRYFAISRGDRWIYFSLLVTEADVWMMNLE